MDKMDNKLPEKCRNCNLSEIVKMRGGYYVRCKKTGNMRRVYEDTARPEDCFWRRKLN